MRACVRERPHKLHINIHEVANEYSCISENDHVRMRQGQKCRREKKSRAGYVGWLYAGMRWCCMGVTELCFRLAGRAMWAGCMLEKGGVAWVSPGRAAAWLGGLCVLLGWMYAGMRWCCMGVTWLAFRLTERAIM